ncbi:glutamine-hydrolyzing asparagine synthase [Bimuria novae-zelandiae CBS 107.79]|uniref:Glutamine-hydrolyzing asparagine synthase n=1 Tax=Bimuria novae-zelandiae CBS 107.79 TaxID=1447943 RepID=A0A6A5UHX9_9PLEO|nr:glutamine-hydrolyzing asparagine synthase [Bimuria novae-zelandiae CBS 107.79]
MCGISCVITLKGNAPKPHSYGAQNLSQVYELERAHLSKQMEDSLEVIKHRGPDARGYWFSDHNRVDLSPEADQPFHDTSNNVHAVIVGEFYDWEDIRADLVAKGHAFKSHCDSEILIGLYKEYGMSMMEHLRGEFAFVLYDSKNQVIIAARDRYGVKPLFYTVHDGRLLIASEMKAFLAFGWQPEWDVQSILESAYLTDIRTLFQGVQRIQAGRYLSVQSFGAISQMDYWDIEYPKKHEIETRSEEDMIQGVRERLLNAVRVRLRADVPVGIFLSGGLDSSAIAGMVKHLMVEKGVHLGNEEAAIANMNCFSIKFLDEPGDGFDEEPIAQRTSEWLGVKKHVVRMTEDEFVKNYSDAAWFCEIPNMDLCFIGKLVLSRLTREKGVKVVLTGEGSDEQFAGYATLLVDFLREPDESWPSRTLPDDLRLKLLAREQGYGGDQASIQSFRPTDPPSAIYAKQQINNVSIISAASVMPVESMLAPWTYQEFGTQDPRVTGVHNVLPGTVRKKIQVKWHPIHSALYIWQKLLLQNILLVSLGDRVEMGNSVEGRQPFLDHHLTEYVNRLPPSVKLRYGPETKSMSEKWILKEAAKPFVTEELYKRRKHPFSAPVKYATDGPLHRYIGNLVTKENIEQLGFFEWEKCKTLVEDGFVQKDAVQMRKLFVVSQLIEISKRFRVKRAVPEYALQSETVDEDNTV